jgi:hypothetical protein
MLSLIDINWIVGLIMSLGLVTVIALAICAPAAAAVLGRIVGDILRTRLGLAVVIGAACLYGGLVYGDLSGRREERATCQAMQRAAEEKAAARDAKQGDLAAADEQASNTQLKSDSLKDKEQTDALRQADASCHPISADQLR